MTPTDEEWRERFKNMTPVPFPEELAEKIRQQAKEQPKLAKSRLRESVSHRIRVWKTTGVALAGVAVAGVIVASVFPFGKGANQAPLHAPLQAPVQGPKSSASSSATSGTTTATLPGTAQNQTSSMAASVAGFGLQAAKLNIGPVQVGSGPTWPTNSYVKTNLTNIGTQPVSNKNTFGILYFTKPGVNVTSWTQSDSATFVNVLNSPTQPPIAPSSIVQWSFHPVGAPHANDGSLTEVPHLAFYQTGLVNANQADQFWMSAPVQIQIVSVQPTLWANHQAQTISLHMSVTNSSLQSVKMHNLWFIIWFSSNPSADFTQPNVVRFLDFAPSQQQGAVLTPGGQLMVNLQEVGGANTNFGAMYPHVAAVLR